MHGTVASRRFEYHWALAILTTNRAKPGHQASEASYASGAGDTKVVSVVAVDDTTHNLSKAQHTSKDP